MPFFHVRCTRDGVGEDQDEDTPWLGGEAWGFTQGHREEQIKLDFIRFEGKEAGDNPLVVVMVRFLVYMQILNFPKTKFDISPRELRKSTVIKAVVDKNNRYSESFDEWTSR